MENYLEAEQFIIDRLDGLAANPHILAATDAPARGKLSPALHVLYAGDQIPGSPDSGTDDGYAQVVTQQWMVIVAVRDVQDMQGGTGVRATAGPLIADVLGRLSGWEPGPGFTPMRRVQAPGPRYVDGFGFFPLMFVTQLLFTGD